MRTAIRTTSNIRTETNVREEYVFKAKESGLTLKQISQHPDFIALNNGKQVSVTTIRYILDRYARIKKEQAEYTNKQRQITHDCDIECMDLRGIIQRPLRRAGITTIAHLIEYSETELSQIYGVGASLANVYKNKLNSFGFTLKPNNPNKADIHVNRLPVKSIEKSIQLLEKHGYTVISPQVALN